MKIDKSIINWKGALYLSPTAYKLLSTMYYMDVEAEDKTYLWLMKIGLSSYKKAKKELVDEGYLQVTQIGRHEYLYKIGDNEKIDSIEDI